MIHENQTELIARAEEVLRGLEAEEADIKLSEAVEATDRDELRTQAMLWDEMCDETESLNGPFGLNSTAFSEAMLLAPQGAEQPLGA